MKPLKDAKKLTQLAELTISRWSSGNTLEREIAEANELNKENPYDESLVEYEELSNMMVDYLEIVVANTLEEWSYEDLSKFTPTSEV